MPVMSVADARQLESSGTIDGQMIAVGGYYDSALVHCYSGVPEAPPLDPACVMGRFAATAGDAQVCFSHKQGAEIDCRGPLIAESYVPMFLEDATGRDAMYGDRNGPVELVVVGHIADPRYWACTQAFLDQCQDRFVADRLVWAAGHTAPDTPPQVFDANYQELTPRLSVDEVAAAVGSDAIVTAVPVQASKVAEIDPRFPMSGNELVWIVRYLADTEETGDTRSANVSVVDDATGKVLSHKPLAMGADYMPARLWLQAERNDLDKNGNVADSLAMEFSLSSPTGDEIYRGPNPGPWEEGFSTQTTGSFLPGLLEPGTYQIDAWLESIEPGSSTEPTRQCSTSVTVAASDNVGLEASFGGSDPCTWGTLSPP